MYNIVKKLFIGVRGNRPQTERPGRGSTGNTGSRTGKRWFFGPRLCTELWLEEGRKGGAFQP